MQKCLTPLSKRRTGLAERGMGCWKITAARRPCCAKVKARKSTYGATSTIRSANNASGWTWIARDHGMIESHFQNRKPPLPLPVPFTLVSV